MAAARILIVEDELHMARTIELILDGRHRVAVASTGKQALEQFTRQEFDVVLLDVNLPDIEGLQLLAEFKQARPDATIIMVTARQDARTAIQAMKSGAYDYLLKPFETEELLGAVERALDRRRLSRQARFWSEDFRSRYGLQNIVGTSDAMRRVLDRVERAASVDSTVLITGETGTGKELVARAIHAGGLRGRGPFVAFNSARYTDSLIESELFGHEAGAFTGAHKAHRGKIEQAHEGTLFLDEVGSMPAPTQGKLLRVLEDRIVERLGGESPIEVDARVIAATNVSLPELIEAKQFRQDLYFRFNVLTIDIPPLRERASDIPLLLGHFLDGAGKQIDSDASELLKNYDWPGNVRELQNLVERLAITVDGPVIQADHVAKELLSRRARQVSDLARIPAGASYEERINLFERQLLSEALERNQWNKAKTAQELGWHRNSLDYKIRKLGITRNR